MLKKTLSLVFYLELESTKNRGGFLSNCLYFSLKLIKQSFICLMNIPSNSKVSLFRVSLISRGEFLYVAASFHSRLLKILFFTFMETYEKVIPNIFILCQRVLQTVNYDRELAKKHNVLEANMYLFLLQMTPLSQVMRNGLKVEQSSLLSKNMIDNEESFNWCLFFQVHRDLHYEFLHETRSLPFVLFQTYCSFVMIIDTQISLLLSLEDILLPLSDLWLLISFISPCIMRDFLQIQLVVDVLVWTVCYCSQLFDKMYIASKFPDRVHISINSMQEIFKQAPRAKIRL